MSYCEGGVGAPLIMIHGLGGSCHWFFPLFPELTSANLRILAPDLPGFGRSPGRVLPVREAARVVIELADRLGLARFFLCGHSLGGAIAAHIAATFGGRVRRLALIDSAGIPDAIRKRWFLRLLQPWSWCPLGFHRTLVGDVLRTGPRNLAAGVRQLRGYDIRPDLERVRVPTLIIWGEHDALTPPEHGRRMLESLAEGRLEIVPGARHLPMVSDPDTTSRLLVEFFRTDLHRQP
jgi:3-oxoadipate enol-lactonase/4-carboxymuconolactone decarboxylase